MWAISANDVAMTWPSSESYNVAAELFDLGYLGHISYFTRGSPLAKMCVGLFGLFLADMWPCSGLLVAQIWQTGVDWPSVLIPHGI